MTEATSNKRIEYIDLAKGFCILLVVFTHAKDGFLVSSCLDNALASFRMPLYFMLSGLFFKEYDNISKFIIKKTNKLFIPFIFFYIVYAQVAPLIIEMIYPRFVTNSGWNYIFCIYNENFNGMPMGIWFLWCLFILNILFYFLVLIAKIRYSPTKFVYILMSLSITLGYLGYWLGSKGINLPLYFDSSLTAIPFFCCGYFLKKFTNILYSEKYNKILPIIAVLCFTLVYILANSYVSYRKNEFDINVLSVYLCGIIGALGVLFMSKKLKKIPFVSFLGRYSIMVLCSHQVILIIIDVFLKKLHFGSWSGVITSFILTCILCYLLIYPMRKYLPYFTAQKDLLR